MNFPFHAKVDSEQDTIKLAGEFIEEVNDSTVVALNGELGSGKTFFVKSVCSYFGINNVNSPTFAIVNEYDGEKKFYHFDFYRIEKIEELYDIGFNDYLNDPGAVIFIEWADMFKKILPDSRIDINIKLNEDFTRDFSFIKHE